MKKYNEKQERHSAKVVEFARSLTVFKCIKIFAIVYFLFIGGVVIAEHGQISIDVLVELVAGGSAVGGGLVLANMAAIGDIDSQTDQYTQGNQIAYKVWLTHIDQVDPDQAWPQPNANREVGTIPLLPGETMHYFGAIDDSVKDNSTGEKGDITTDVTNLLEFTMGGDGAKLYDFIEQYAGGRFIVIYTKCSTGETYISGTACKPMILNSFDRKRDNEATAVMFTFQNKTFKQPYVYVGAIVKTTPQVVAADATDLAIVAGKSQYQLTDNAGATVIVTVSAIIASQYGSYVEVLGSSPGVNASTIADSGVFILIDGVTWTGNPGSKITFMILDDDSLVEVAGTRVQT